MTAAAQQLPLPLLSVVACGAPAASAAKPNTCMIITCLLLLLLPP
jgi:hypothetical protein